MRREYEIVCPRYTFTDGSYAVVIPWFLIPGRPYPVQVYLYACGIYSSDPNLGQRGAAEATRTKFKLEKFSHSTVSRSFKAFEQGRKQCLEVRFGEEVAVCGVESPRLSGVGAKNETNMDGTVGGARRFPSVRDTDARRKGMAGFLGKYLHALEELGAEAASRQFVGFWEKKSRRLLL